MQKLIFLMILICTAIVSQTSPEDFDSLSATEAAEIAPDSLRESLFEAYADALGNWQELAAFIENFSDNNIKLESAIWLINIMPHLDRLLATNRILTEHLEFAYAAREKAPWGIPDSMFLPYILAYRLSYEPVTLWRKIFFDKFSSEAFGTGDPKKAARKINGWIDENIDTSGWDFFGGMQSPDMTYKRRKGSRSEISSLTVAILKSLGIPSRNASIRTVRGEGASMNWVEVFDVKEDSWFPLYPDSPEHFGDFAYPAEKYPGGITVVNVKSAFEYDFNTSKYTPIGKLRVYINRRGKPVDKWEHFSVTVFSGGAYWPLDEIGTATDSTGIFEFELGVGEYVLQNGTRDNTGSVWVQTFPFAIKEGEITEIEIEVSAPQYMEEQTESGILPVFTLNDLSGNPFTHTQIKANKPTILAIFDPKAEPSIRAKTVIDGLSAEFGDSIRFFNIIIEEDNDESPKYDSERRTLIDKGATLTMSFLGYHELEALKMEALPAIIFCPGTDLRFEVISRGYNTSLKNLIEERIALWLSR
ncbi:hypothetical protein KAH81_06205 [bacterium]|nr:hypothetical protein [bacterium]